MTLIPGVGEVQPLELTEPQQKMLTRWIEALENEEYVACRGALRTRYSGTDRFCALGVLYDLYDPTGWEKDGARWVYNHEMQAIKAVGTRASYVASLNDHRSSRNPHKAVVPYLKALRGEPVEE